MPARLGGFVDVLFTGVKDGKLATASISVDTDNDPSKFQITHIQGRELPKGVLFPAFEGMSDASDLVELADQIVTEQATGGTQRSFLDKTFSRMGMAESLTIPATGITPSAAEIFDSLTYWDAGSLHA